jgi:hypothetical protein
MVRWLIVVLPSLVIGASALAQNPQAAPPGVSTPPMAPPNSASPPPEQIAPPGKDAQSGSGTLSDRLSSQGGTLKPPPVDPGMTVNPPAQSQGTMPVIPPPGSAGGNPQVQPK